MRSATNLLAVSPDGVVTLEDLQAYHTTRQHAIAERLESLSGNEIVKKWMAELSPSVLYEEKGEKKYLGAPSGEAKAVEALLQLKDSRNMTETIAAAENLIHYFCGFDTIKAKCLVNAVHFQYEVDTMKLMSAKLPALSSVETLGQMEKDIFDDAGIAAAELLLRAVRQADDGTLIADPFSPGMPMGFLLKLPMFAQLVMVLTNVVEATWYQEEIPNCPMSINVYASLLVDGAPVLDIVGGVTSVEVMEMTKGAKRGREVVEWVKELRDHDKEVLLDDFDTNHPAANSSPHGIKVCVFANAFHSLQAFKEGGALDEDGEPLDMSMVDKDHVNDKNFKDFYCTIVPKMQPHIKKLVMEGSENCLKSEVNPGPPLNFSQPLATLATAHVYQAAARSFSLRGIEFRMLHQGGRALYDGEDFDDNMIAVIHGLGAQMISARAQAGTVCWTGAEAQRRATLGTRPRVCGVVKQVHCAGLAKPNRVEVLAAAEVSKEESAAAEKPKKKTLAPTEPKVEEPKVEEPAAVPQEKAIASEPKIEGSAAAAELPKEEVPAAAEVLKEEVAVLAAKAAVDEEFACVRVVGA